MQKLEIQKYIKLKNLIKKGEWTQMTKKEKQAYRKGVTDILLGLGFILIWTSMFVYVLVK